MNFKGRRRYTEKSVRLFNLMDELEKCMNDMEYQVIKVRSNRLDHVERNAIEIERIGIELQKLVESMRRANSPSNKKKDISNGLSVLNIQDYVRQRDKGKSIGEIQKENNLDDAMLYTLELAYTSHSNQIALVEAIEILRNY